MPKTTDELESENNDLRQLLQAAAALVEALLAGQDVRTELTQWLQQIQSLASD